jgi:hypothetical protein
MVNERLQMGQLFFDQLFDAQSLLAASELQCCVHGFTLHSAIGIHFFPMGHHGFHQAIVADFPTPASVVAAIRPANGPCRTVGRCTTKSIALRVSEERQGSHSLATRSGEKTRSRRTEKVRWSGWPAEFGLVEGS